jgi:hypothetical protein
VAVFCASRTVSIDVPGLNTTMNWSGIAVGVPSEANRSQRLAARLCPAVPASIAGSMVTSYNKNFQMGLL